MASLKSFYRGDPSTIDFFVLTLLFKVVYEVLYFVVLSERYDDYYARLNLTLMDVNGLKCVLSYLFFFLIGAVLPTSNSRPSTQLMQLYFVMAVLPMLSYFWLADASWVYTVYYVLCFCLMSLLVRMVPDVPIRVIGFRKTPPIENVVIMFLPVVLFLFSLFNTFPNMGLVDIRTVYDFRASHELSAVWGYLVSWLGAALIPFCMIVFLVKKKYLPALFSIGMEVYLYLCTGNKIFLFFNVLCVVLVFGLVLRMWKVWVPSFFSAVIVTAGSIYVFLGIDVFIGIAPHRLMALPAALSYKYYDFFSVHPKVGYAEGTIGKVLHLSSPYDATMSEVIGQSAGTNAVSGFLGNAYGNGGFAAMLLSALIVAALFLFVDGVSWRSRTRYLYTGLMLYPLVALINSALPTTLLNGGVLLLLVLMFLFASQEASWPGCQGRQELPGAARHKCT